MTDMANDISVIICAYTEERWYDLMAAIESVQQQTPPPSEIIVVIDHNPRLLKRVQERLPGEIVVENTEARGLSGARNSGIRAARSQMIAFLDDDAVAAPNWLMQLSQGLTDPHVLGTGGTVMPLWSTDAPGWLPEEFYWVIGCTYRGMPQTAAAIRNPIGANMAFKRKVFDAVGGFRNGIGRVGKWPVGCEETELCIRAGQYWPQHTFLYQPQARVFHHVPDNRARFRYFCSRCYGEGLSKAIVSRYVGAKESLTSERAYTLRVLPQALLRGLKDGLFYADVSGFQRAGVIVLGLMVTMMGYLMGSVAQHSVLLDGNKKSTQLSLKPAAPMNR
ncbi:MAG: glycosyltransferase family 2 protein [Ktedonobacteraceae bacterium]